MLNLKNRSTLMASLPKNGVGVEVGVSEGLFSETLLQVCTPSVLYLVDPWLFLQGKEHEEDAANVSQPEQEQRYQAVCGKFALLARVQIVRDFSVSFAAATPFLFPDWVYLDGDHTQVDQDIAAWWPKIKRGGWLTGHDYLTCGDHLRVKHHVDTFVKKEKLPLFVTEGDSLYEKNYPSWAVQKR